MDSHKTFLDELTISPKLCEVYSLKDNDAIIAFVPIVSKAGTDISAAMKKIPGKYKQLYFTEKQFSL